MPNDNPYLADLTPTSNAPVAVANPYLADLTPSASDRITPDMPIQQQLAIANASPQAGHLKEGGTYRPPGRKAIATRTVDTDARARAAFQAGFGASAKTPLLPRSGPSIRPANPSDHPVDLSGPVDETYTNPIGELTKRVSQVPGKVASILGVSQQEHPYIHAALDFVGGFAAFPLAVASSAATTASDPIGTAKHLPSTVADALHSVDVTDPNISGPERLGRILNAAAIAYGGFKGVEGVRAYLKTPEGIAKFATLKEKLKVSDHGANVALDSLGRDIQHGQPVHPKENIHAVPIKETGGVGLREQDAVGEGVGGQNRPVEAAPESQPPAAPQQAQEPVAVHPDVSPNAPFLNAFGMKGKYETLRTGDVGVMPGIQHRSDINPATGEVRSSGSVSTFDQGTAPISVWKDSEGKYWVVNGHHRLGIANRAGEPTIAAHVYDSADGMTFEKARLQGALENIRDKTAQPLDVVQALREGGISTEKLNAMGLNPKAGIAKDALALNKLTDASLDMVRQHEVSQEVAAGIGDAGLPPDREVAAMRKARNLKTRQEGEMLAESARTAPLVKPKGEQGSMSFDDFGDELALEEQAKIGAAAAKRLASDKRLAGFVAKGRAHGGTVIDLSAQEHAQAVSELAQSTIKSDPSVNSILERESKNYAENRSNGQFDKSVDAVVESAIEAAKKRHQELFGRGTGVDAQDGVRGPTGGEPPTSLIDVPPTPEELRLTSENKPKPKAKPQAEPILATSADTIEGQTGLPGTVQKPEGETIKGPLDKSAEPPKGKHPDIYRETSAARYWDRSYSGEDTYWATHPDLALGQGENKGVLIRFRPKDSAILRENPKPGIDPTGIKELVVGRNQPTNSGRLPGDVVSVTIKKGTKLPVEMKLNLQTFSKDGNPNRVYTKETLPNGDVVFYTKLSEGFKPDAKPAEHEAGKAASAPPASSKLGAFKQSLRDSIAQDEADLKKGLGNNPERGATNIPQHVAVVAKKALLYALETGEKVWKAVERFGKTLTPAERKMALDHAKELHDKNGGELGADHFDPLEPQIKSIIADTNGGFAAEIKQTFNAPAMSRLAGVAARTLRASMGRISQAVQIREVALDKISKVFDKMAEPDRLDFIDKMESGDSQPSPELQQVADVLRSQLDIQRDRIQSLGKGWLDDYIENYFPHIWETKGKGGMPAFLERLVPKRRSLTGRGEFLMQRSVPTIKDGIDSGLVPVSTNPVELARLKLRSMDQFLLGHQAIMELKSEGLLKFHPAGYALPKGWSVIDDKFSTIFNKEDVGKIDGKWIAPDPVVRVVNNFLSPGLRGKSWYKAMQGANNALLQARLGLSGFHAGFVTMDTTISKMSLGIQKLGEGDVVGAMKDFAATPTAPITTFLKGKKGIEQYLAGPDAGPIIEALIEGGLRVKQDPFYSQYAAETFSRLVKDRRYGRALLKAPQAALHLASKPIMEGLVPRMKVGAAMDMAEFELKRLGPDATRDEIREAMAKVVDSVDNRLGQLNYDNLFWDRTTKDVTALLMQSSGWNIGTVRELGGGARDVFSVGRRAAGGPRITSRTAYAMATAAVPAIYGAIYMYLRTGHGPQSLRDYYQPRTGVTDDNGNEERVSLPSYAKDVLSYATHPLETLKNKESPLLSMSQELMANEDYYRDPIRKTDNPLYMQALDIAQYVAQGFTPFAYRKWSEQTPERRTEQFFGIAKAPKDTSDETQGEQYYRQGLGALSKAKELGYSRSGSRQPSRPPVRKP